MNIVPGAGRHKNSVVFAELPRLIQLVFAGSHRGTALSSLYADELIGVRVILQTDFTPGRDAHQGHLQVTAGPEGGAKICVLLRRFSDIGGKGDGTVIGRRTPPVAAITGFVRWNSSLRAGYVPVYAVGGKGVQAVLRPAKATTVGPLPRLSIPPGGGLHGQAAHVFPLHVH